MLVSSNQRDGPQSNCPPMDRSSGPAVWNSLPEYVRDSSLSFHVVRQYLKTFLFVCY